MQDNKHISQSVGRWKLLAVIAVCAAPLIASYLTYYVIKPAGRTNYGALLDPRSFPIPVSLGGAAFDTHAANKSASSKQSAGSQTISSQTTGLGAYKGKWVLLQVHSSDCQSDCEKKLHDMRQLRLAQGKEMTRLERVWLVTDNQSLQMAHWPEYQGTQLLRVDPAVVQKWLPVEQGTVASDHLYMIDPLGNLMMRFPKDADPNKVKKDISKLLRASRIG